MSRLAATMTVPVVPGHPIGSGCNDSAATQVKDEFGEHGDSKNMGNFLITLGRAVAGAVLGFVCCSIIWFSFWYGIAWCCEGRPPVLRQIPAGMILGEPTWVLIIFSIPIVGALHGLVAGAGSRIPQYHSTRSRGRPYEAASLPSWDSASTG